MFRAGTILGGKYCLIEPIGVGGMGAVWRAEHLGLSRPVAVKSVLAGQGAEAVERFTREAKVAARIRHRNVVGIDDFGMTDDGDPYIVMDLLDGESLGDRFARRPKLGTPELVEIITGALTGLEAVHAEGVVHRDIKPNNVFLSREVDSVVPKLLDFGLSRATAAGDQKFRKTITLGGMIVGTPEYMSPEQARGRRDLDERTDLYSVGVILYEGLAGVAPFEAESPEEILSLIVMGACAPLEETAPDVPVELARIVHRAMARDREERFPTAWELKEALLAACRAGAAAGPTIRESGENPIAAPRRTSEAYAPTIASVPERHGPPTLESPPGPRGEPARPAAPATVPEPGAGAGSKPDPGLERARRRGRVARDTGSRIARALPTEQIPARSRPWPRVVAVAVGLLALGVLAGLGLRSKGPPPQAAVLPWSPPRASSPPAVPSPPAASSFPVATSPASRTSVRVTLRGVPADAIVEVDGVVASGPIDLPADGRRRRIDVRAPSRAPWSVFHVASSDGEYVVALPIAPEPIPEPAAGVPATDGSVRGTPDAGAPERGSGSRPRPNRGGATGPTTPDGPPSKLIRDPDF
ncbi:MAG: protein kinase [Deltaproteobacteria bacterium]|nr:protein kinase [Deltaproteobacteria bacterium]